MPTEKTAPHTLQSPHLPVAQIITYNQFTGTPARQVAIPSGHIGLVVKNGQVEKELPPGDQIVVGWDTILLGKASEIQLVLIKTETVREVLGLNHLQTNDNEAIDLQTRVTFQISDPARFYAAFLNQIGPVTPTQLLAEMITESIEREIASAIKQYSLVELTTPSSQTVMAQAVAEALPAAAESWGVEIGQIDQVLIQPAEDIVRQWEKLQALRGKLHQVNLNVAMDAAEQQAMMRDVVRQMEQDYNLPPNSLMEQAEQQVEHLETAALKAGWVAQIERMQNQIQTGLQQRHQRLRRRVERNDVTSTLPPNQPWWFHWIKALKWGGTLVSLLFLGLAVLQPGRDATEVWSRLIYVVTGIPFAFVMFWFALHLDKRMAFKQAGWYTRHRLTALSGGDLQQTDGLVRHQLATELQQVAHAVQETRQRVYQQGHETEALRLGEVRRWAENLASKVQQPATGAPVYLSNTIESWGQLEQLLTYDEELLDFATVTNQLAHDTRQVVINNQNNLPAQIIDLESHLADFEQTFETRSRIQPFLS